MFVISHFPSIRATSKSAGGGVHDFAGLDIDVVALEVQRAPVAVDRDLELVRRVIRDPVVLAARTSLPSPTRTVGSRPARTRSSPVPTVIVAFGAIQAHHQVDVLGRGGVMEVLLDLIDLPHVLESSGLVLLGPSRFPSHCRRRARPRGGRPRARLRSRASACAFPFRSGRWAFGARRCSHRRTDPSRG